MNKIRDELIKIRTIFDFDIVKGKQKLTLLIQELEKSNDNSGDEE
jgi:hypothetical protein